MTNKKTAYNRRLAQWRVTWLIKHSTSHQLLWCIDSFVLRNPPLRQAPKRSEEIPSGFPRYGSGLHTSSTALRDCPRTWVSRKRETCVKPRAVIRNNNKTFAKKFNLVGYANFIWIF